MTSVHHAPGCHAHDQWRWAVAAALLCAVAATTAPAFPSGRVQLSLNLSTDFNRVQVEFAGTGLLRSHEGAEGVRHGA